MKQNNNVSYVRNIIESVREKVPQSILSRGLDLYDAGYVELEDKEFFATHHQFEFWVESASLYDEYYNVYIYLNNRGEVINCKCDCEYAQRNKACKHIVAAAFELSELVEDDDFDTEIDHEQILLPSLTTQNVLNLLERGQKTALNNLLKQKDVINCSVPDNGIITGTVRDKLLEYTLLAKRTKGQKSLEVRCNCGVDDSVCLHKIAFLYRAAELNSPYALEESLNWDVEKSQVLSEIGLRTDDDYSEYVTFSYIDGVIQAELRKDISVLGSDNLKYLTLNQSEKVQLPEKIQSEFEIGYVFYYKKQWNNSKSIDLLPISGKPKNGHIKTYVQPIENYNYDRRINTIVDEEDIMLFRLRERILHLNEQVLRESNTAESIGQHLLEKRDEILESCFNILKNKQVFIAPDISYMGEVGGKNIIPVEISNERVETILNVDKEKHFIKINAVFSIGEKEVKIKNQFVENLYFVNIEQKLYLWKNYFHRLPALFFQSSPGSVLFPINKIDEFYSFITPYQEHITVNFHDSMVSKTGKPKPKRKIIFSETGNFLVVMPIVKYGDTELKVNPNSSATKINAFTNGEISVIERDVEYENAFRSFIADQHDSFSAKSNHEYFYLKSEEVMKKMWFVRFCQACKDEEVEIFGLKNLKKLKYYPGTAKISYGYKSEIDWFNTEVNVQFGDEQVSLKDIQKAVLKNDGLIKLSDDSLGVLPEEWIKKWKTALELGKIKDNELKLTKSQFAIVNALYEDIDHEELNAELGEKLKLLEGFDKLEKIKPSTKLKATLRDYQHEGLNWLAFLVEFGFGGCLADDMGLGKTVQMLALILYLKHTKKTKKTHLVICPTTLLFNWEKEIDKFCPHLKSHTYWGTNRDTDISNWKNFDVVLSSYGTVTNDIETIRKHKLGALILDESQAIKNPGSLRHKAVSLLRSDYRFSMTGTPIENNTVELFSQMQFLNPGLLGTLNYFKKEFATPIDKGLAPDKAEELRKLVYPFLLRRTKEVVAKELPEKTEMILYCEMEKEQRRVYDAFVGDFREQILTDIDEDGMDKSRFKILDALLKARQICDSPALLNTEEDYGNASIKTEELLRNIERKTRNHKVLVFSQFVGMLNIIRQRLDADGVKYAYLDGSTRNREEVVEQFVSDESVRVFLISLKAGGFGLNLTCADYVYLVDPWWNPAVEAQAIDRVHRIGQDKKVFAYRMICKDTIEEKIIKLQEKKKSLAKEIISSEQSFVKNLTRSDIEDLFS